MYSMSNSVFKVSELLCISNFALENTSECFNFQENNSDVGSCNFGYLCGYFIKYSVFRLVLLKVSHNIHPIQRSKYKSPLFNSYTYLASLFVIFV